MAASYEWQEIEENLEKMEQHALEYEQSVRRASPDSEQVHWIFRFAHNLKSSFGMMGFAHCSRLVHALESYFDQLRKGKDQPRAEVLAQTLLVIDTLKATANAGVEDVARLSVQLNHFEQLLAPLSHQPMAENLPFALTPEQERALEQAVLQKNRLYLMERLVSSHLSLEALQSLPCWEELAAVGSILAASPVWETRDQQAKETLLRLLFCSTQTPKQLAAAITDPFRELHLKHLPPNPLTVVVCDLPEAWSFPLSEGLEKQTTTWKTLLNTEVSSEALFVLYFEHLAQALEQLKLFPKPSQRGQYPLFLVVLGSPCLGYQELWSLCQAGADGVIDSPPDPTRLVREIGYLRRNHYGLRVGAEVF